jgi:hypothetical protein
MARRLLVAKEGYGMTKYSGLRGIIGRLAIARRDPATRTAKKRSMLLLGCR